MRPDDEKAREIVAMVFPAQNPAAMRWTPLRDAIAAALSQARAEAASVDLARLHAWLFDGAKDALTAFTAGPLRDLAREMEYRLKQALDEGRAEAYADTKKAAEDVDPHDAGYSGDSWGDGFADCRKAIMTAIEARAKEPPHA